MPRPTLRNLFVNAPKRLEVGFYTSSIDKFLQARLVFQECGLILRHFISSQDPYHEDYNLGQKQLLSRAIDEIKYRLGVNSIFFVEDTSLKITALSSPNMDKPGLEVKEWFARTSFSKVDAELKQRGNDRSATIYSDIALHIPGLNRAVFLHGETSGLIAENSPNFLQSDQYPWLTPNTFNGWFIPAGATKRLGEMSFEESIEHDFRVKSLFAVIDRIEEYAAVLNLNGHSYSVKRLRTATATRNLFDDDVSLYIIVGKICAGKTTFGQYVSSRHSYRFIEASNIMRMIAEENGITAPTPFYQARDLLHAKGPDVIARQIVSMFGEDLSDRVVITGFRTIEELQYIRIHFPNCKVVYIDASERTRFERHIRRGRVEDIRTLRDFQEHDKQQWGFGLLPVALDMADIKVENEGTITDFYAQIDALIEKAPAKIPGVSEIKLNRKTLIETRVFRCLQALERFSAPASCPEIAKITERDMHGVKPEHVERISPRHVNWVLKDFPELARRINVKGDKIRYEILPAGRAYLSAVRAMKD
jgi:dephospho-CoA kinase/inosine/xanthosine triphosphate pyrophosphatase family protein